MAAGWPFSWSCELRRIAARRLCYRIRAGELPARSRARVPAGGSDGELRSRSRPSAACDGSRAKPARPASADLVLAVTSKAWRELEHDRSLAEHASPNGPPDSTRPSWRRSRRGTLRAAARRTKTVLRSHRFRGHIAGGPSWRGRRSGARLELVDELARSQLFRLQGVTEEVRRQLEGSSLAAEQPPERDPWPVHLDRASSMMSERSNQRRRSERSSRADRHVRRSARSALHLVVSARWTSPIFRSHASREYNAYLD